MGEGSGREGERVREKVRGKERGAILCSQCTHLDVPELASFTLT